MVEAATRLDDAATGPNLGFGPYVTMSGPAAELTIVGHVAVAEVAGISASSLRRTVTELLTKHGTDPARALGALDAVATGNPSWRSTVEQLASEVDSAILNFVALSFCTFPLLASAEQLSSQIAERRRNAVLDLLDLPYSSIEVHDAVRQLAEEVTGGSTKDGSSALSHLKKAKPVAEALSFFHPFVGLGLTYALDRIPDDSPAKQSENFDDEALVLARVVAGLSAAHAVEAQRALALPVRDQLVAAALNAAPHEAAAGDEEQFSRLVWAATVLSTAHELAPNRDVFGELVGMTVEVAAVIGRAAGATVLVHDAAANGATGSEDESLSWKVIGIGSASGKELALQAVRPSQASGAHEGPRSDKCEFLAGASRADLDRHWDALADILGADADIQWMAKATNLWLCASRNDLLAYQEPSLAGPLAVQWTLAYKNIRHVETGKEWFDWFVRLHSEHSSSRANFGGNKPLVEEVAHRLRNATSNP